ncbi:MAG: hypothetical protein U1E65_10845 [Myxococcota bacterium]
MSERDVRERDILVASNEYAYVQDLTKGDIVLYVGPTKISLSNTERLVDYKNDRFVPVRSDEGLGVCPFVSASSGQYIVLDNPPKDPSQKPLKGSNATIELMMGRKIVVPGPATFPLWPGQRAKVVQGHALRDDEFLILRVYDKAEGIEHPIGTELMVDGSSVSFYIPRTGLEVVPTDKGYVRRAWRLRRSMGLHLRVVKPFVAKEGGAIPAGNYLAGQELLLRDREGFFFPTDTLEVVGIVQAIPLAEREGIYVRHLETGRINTIVGPLNYLPDPTQVEIVNRSLDKERAELYGVTGRDPSRAISVQIPAGFAVLVTGKKSRQVVTGPETRILSYDEDLEILRLSTGKPKSDEAVLTTCFLQVDGNKVSDLVEIRTADHVALMASLSYRVSFVRKDGIAERWFNVRNYVDLLCDHLGSILRAAARSVSIDELHRNGTEILRSAVLGEKKAEGPRAGRTFEENGMWIYDVEVLDLRILDAEVEELLGGAQKKAIAAEVARREEMLRLTGERLREEVDREILGARIETLVRSAEAEQAERRLKLAQAETKAEADRTERLGRANNEAEAQAILESKKLELQERRGALERLALEAKVRAFKEEMAALEPELIATLKTLGNQQLSAELMKHASPLAILGGSSVAEVVEKLLARLPIGSVGAEGVSGVLKPNGVTRA